MCSVSADVSGDVMSSNFDREHIAKSPRAKSCSAHLYKGVNSKEMSVLGLLFGPSYSTQIQTKT